MQVIVNLGGSIVNPTFGAGEAALARFHILLALLGEECSRFYQRFGEYDVGDFKTAEAAIRPVQYLNDIFDELGQHTGRDVHVLADVVMGDFSGILKTLHCVARRKAAVAQIKNDIHFMIDSAG